MATGRGQDLSRANPQLRRERRDHGRARAVGPIRGRPLIFTYEQWKAHPLSDPELLFYQSQHLGSVKAQREWNVGQGLIMLIGRSTRSRPETASGKFGP